MKKKVKKWTLATKIICRFLIRPSSPYFTVVESVCKKELQKKPNDFYSNWFLGELYVQHKEYDKALKVLEPLYRSGRGGQRLKELIARAYFNVKNYKRVINLLEKEDIKDANSATYYMGISLIEEGNPELGIKYLERYVLSHPNDYNVHWKIGYEYYRIKNFEKALNSYLEARKLKPSEKLEKGIKLCKERLG